MKIDKLKFKCAGIYVIKNSINGKVYVGKSFNCYRRLKQHIYDINHESRNSNENFHLLSAVKKYGFDNFECHLLESIPICDKTEELLAEKELQWMIELNSLDPDKGYNLRFDSQGKCFCSKETSDKISKRLKSEWKSGIRSDHSSKMKEYWKDNSNRKDQQSKLMSKNKTKYTYTIYKNDQLITDSGTYETLKSLNLDKKCFSYFSKHKCDKYELGDYKVIRTINKDRVHPKEKSLDK